MGKINQRIAAISWLFCSALSTASIGQFNLGFKEDLSLIFNEGNDLRLSTTGGFSFPQFGQIKLNADDDLDLVVFDRGMNILKMFIYNAQTQEYDYSPEFETAFPSDLIEMLQLRDYDCDGFNDLFTYGAGGFKVYRNNAAFPPQFELVKSKLKSTYGSIFTGIYLLPGDMPAIVDVDNDGDLDILTFGNVNSENTIEYHQNQSIENYGNCDSLEFIAVTQCWGNIEEPANTSVLVSTTCKGIVPPNARDERFHPGSTLLAIDTDADTDLDIIIGDIQTDELVFAINAGDANSASIDVNQQSTDFPNAQDKANMQYMVTGFQIDADQNGSQDLVLSVNNRIDSSCNAEHIWLYDNTSLGAANYVLNTKEFLIGEMLDLGSSAVPAEMDVDGDGLNDLLIASSFKRTPTTNVKSRLHYFKNIGSSANPKYSLANGDFAQWSIFGFADAYPALGDLDGDGDLDMLVGVASGDLYYFTNTPSGGLANFSLTQPEYMNIQSIGSNAAPEIADVNGDGKLDLLIGEKLGYVSYFENTGTTSSAAFASLPTIAKFGGIDISYFCCNGYAAPKFLSDGTHGSGKYLFIGTSEKQIKIYELSQQLTDTFALVDSILINAGRIAPLLSDLTNDGINDLLVGTGEGGVKFYKSDANYPVGLLPITAKNSSMNIGVFPNPARETTIISIEPALKCSIVITDMWGRVMSKRLSHMESAIQIDVSTFPAGIYTVALFHADGVQTQSLAIVH